MTRSALVALLVAGVLMAVLAYALSAGLKSSSKGTPAPASRVFDEATGRPVPGAEIWVMRASRSALAKVSPEGLFRVGGREGEAVLVEASAPGYAPVGLRVARLSKGWTCELPMRPLGDCKALPSGQGILVVDALGQARGWDLEGGKAAGGDDADLLPSADLKGNVAALLAVNGAKLAPVAIPEGRIPAWEFERAVAAPGQGWAPTAEVRHPGQILFVRTRQGRFAKVLLTGAGAEVSFRWVLQPDGSKRLAQPFVGQLGEGRP